MSNKHIWKGLKVFFNYYFWSKLVLFSSCHVTKHYVGDKKNKKKFSFSPALMNDLMFISVTITLKKQTFFSILTHNNYMLWRKRKSGRKPLLPRESLPHRPPSFHPLTIAFNSFSRQGKNSLPHSAEADRWSRALERKRKNVFLWTVLPGSSSRVW